MPSGYDSCQLIRPFNIRLKYSQVNMTNAFYLSAIEGFSSAMANYDSFDNSEILYIENLNTTATNFFEVRNGFPVFFFFV